MMFVAGISLCLLAAAVLVEGDAHATAAAALTTVAGSAATMDPPEVAGIDVTDAEIYLAGRACPYSAFPLNVRTFGGVRQPVVRRNLSPASVPVVSCRDGE